MATQAPQNPPSSSHSPSAGTIGVVVATAEELEALRPALQTLRDLGCHYEVLLSSLWAAPERLLGWAERAESRAIRVILATAGAEPQLPGFLAAACRLPVVALPLPSPRHDPARLMELVLQTSSAAPVACVAPGAALEAALLVTRILAPVFPELNNAIELYRQSLLERLEEAHTALADQPAAAALPLGPRTSSSATATGGPSPSASTENATPLGTRTPSSATTPSSAAEPLDPAFEEPVEIRPANLDRPLSGQPVPAPRPSVMPARMLGRLKVDPDIPDVQVIEDAIDCLLEGGVIAFPTETVYGLAADATNPAACERLYELKGRPHSKAITLMVDSPKLLGHIACNLTTEARRLMEAFWPGPLTLIFQKRGENFRHVSDSETIGVRLPDHSIPLAIMQALARPLACTSANISGQPECFSADEVERAFPGQLNLILDGGKLQPNQPSTVVDVTNEPYRILRQGAVTRPQLAAVIGDKLEQE